VSYNKWSRTLVLDNENEIEIEQGIGP